MAEGGRGDEDDKNAYNFRNFNVPISNCEQNDEEASGDKLNEPDLGVPLKRDIGRLIIVDDEKASRKDDNPFSFRHFLNMDQSNSSKCESLRHSQSVDSDSLKQRDRVGPDVAQSVLPDFVQDHLILESTSNTNVSGTHCLPDLRLPFDAGPTNLAANKSVVGTRGSRDDLVLDPSCRPKNIRKKTAVPQQSSDVSVTSSLPDFLSDGPMSTNHGGEGIQGMSSMVQVQRNESCESSELTELRDERDALSKQLDETRQLLAAESNKVFRLQKEVERFREKEVDEMVALEQAVNQVEANLHSTTQRAVNSETVIMKLKQEIKALQSQVSCLKSENASFQGRDRAQTSSIAEKAKAAAERITTAASTAEQQLRQLLSGLDSLRLISAILLDVDRVVTDESDPSSSS